jgi:DNA polymerase-1
MVVETLAHGKLVLDRLMKRQEHLPMRDVSIDTEFEKKPQYKGKKDTLVWGRADVVIWSICYRGESYSFPTNFFDTKYPTLVQWGKLLRPIVEDASIAKIGQNIKIDIHQFEQSANLWIWRNVWDTMIGGWIANPARDKGLKSRAPLYGRHLRKTSTIRFDDLRDLGKYGEEDVIQTDESFQMQLNGFIQRPSVIYRINARGLLIAERNNLPSGVIRAQGEALDKFGKIWLRLHEFPIQKSTIRAENIGFGFNAKRIREIRAKLIEDKEASLKKIYRAAGEKFNLNSPKQLGVVFTRMGLASAYKTKSGKPSYNEKALYMMQEQHSIVPEIVNHRRLTKLYTVYVSEKGLEYYLHTEGRIHCTMNTCGAVTGRFSVQLPNLTQIPSKRDIYGIKDCFIARKGFKIVCLDYAQLEIRVMAILSKDPAMQKILCDPDGDIHTNTAEQFGVERDPTAKQLNFLQLYGGMAYMLSEKLSSEGVPTSQSQAQAYITRYDEIYYRVREYREELLDHHQKHGYVKLLTGRRRWLDDINWDDKRSVHKAETTLSNNTVQGSGQDLLKATIIRTDWRNINPDKAIQAQMVLPPKHKAIIADYGRRLEKLRDTFKKAQVNWILQIHDEALWEVEESAAEEVGNLLAEVMCWRHFFPAITSYNIPIVADGGIGSTWKIAKGKNADVRLEAGFQEEEPVKKLPKKKLVLRLTN